MTGADTQSLPPAPDARAERRDQRRARRRRSNQTVAVLAAAAFIGGLFAGAHPTGTAGVDELYAGLVAAFVTVACSRSSRSMVLLVTAVGVGMSRTWLWFPAVSGLAVAFVAVLQRRRYSRLGALGGALFSQVLLRWPPVGFHGLTALVAAGCVAMIGGSAYANLRTPQRRRALLALGGLVGLAVVFAVPLAVTGLLARGAVDHGSAAAKTALNEVSSGGTSEAAGQLSAASSDLATAYRDTDAWWDWPSSLVPVVSQQRRAVLDVTRSGRDLTASASSEAQTVDLHAMTYKKGGVDLAAIEAAAPKLHALDDQITATEAVIDRSRSGWLIGPVSRPLERLDVQLGKAQSSVKMATQAVDSAPGLLGGDGVRHYFIAFMTPAETRGLGGFIGSFAEISADRGKLTLVRTARAAGFIPATARASLSGPSDYLERYGQFQPQSFLEDVTYSPDLPTVEKVIAELYPQVGGDHIDGVMVIDPDALAALLNVTGPIDVAGFGQPLTPANAADVLLRQQYLTDTSDSATTQRHDLLDEALSAGFQKLLAGGLPSPERMSSLLDPLVLQGRLLMWTSHPSDQLLLNRLGLSGAFPRTDGASDLLAVTLANAANDKLDAYLREAIDDHVTFNPTTGQVDSTVTIRLTSTAPTSGLPAYVNGSYAGSGLPIGTDELWLSLYSPLKITRASADNQSVSFASTTAELGTEASSTYVRVASGGSTTLTVHLSGQLPRGQLYSMVVRQQPLANPSTLSVDVQPSDASLLADPALSGWTAGPNEVQTHLWSFQA